MKINLVVFIATIIFYGCSVNTNIVGKYASGKNPNCFQIKDDSSYIYEFREFHVYKYSTGTWRKTASNIIKLNSIIKNTTIPFRNIVYRDIDSDMSVLSIIMNINSELQLADYKCLVYINDSIFTIKRCDSLSAIRINVPIKNIYLRIVKEPIIITSNLISLPLSTEKYEFKKKGVINLNLEVSFDDGLFSYRPFNNETIRYKSNYIKIYDSQIKRWQKVPKVPEEANIFILH